jgi:adenylosuccinate synthase
MISLAPGKFNIVIDGQFGSTGKGLLSNYIGVFNHVDIAVSNASSNAGHTFYDADGKKIIVKHLPVSGIVNKRSLIYLCAGSIIDLTVLLKEIEENDIGHDRMAIHPRAAIISSSDIAEEKTNNGGVKKIASTMSGVGSALVKKINRNTKLAEDTPELAGYVKNIDLHYYMQQNCTVLMEVPQGLDLSLNHGFSYPYCTSRDITVAAAMNDANVHPKYLGKVSVSIRTFPIRVGNIVEDGVEVGYSGPFYPDSVETSWKELRLKKEFTTRTNRIRRVATFSHIQYKNMLNILSPDYVFLNFCNYLPKRKINNLLKELREVTHVGFGPTIADILPVTR